MEAVQGTSECVKGKIREIKEMMAEDVDITTIIEPDNVPESTVQLEKQPAPIYTSTKNALHRMPNF